MRAATSLFPSPARSTTRAVSSRWRSSCCWCALHLRAVPHSLGFDDADTARWRLHHGEQVRLRTALARGQRQIRGHRQPQRGDVVVFRYPPNPSINYIKRLVGLPGDRVEVRDDQLIVNGETIALEDAGRFNDGCYDDIRLSTETLGEHTHQVLSCRSPHGCGAHGDSGPGGGDSPRWLATANSQAADGRLRVPGNSDPARAMTATITSSRSCLPGHYLMIGDNRDNSEDGRDWGIRSGRESGRQRRPESGSISICSAHNS